jgi:hypothetical protein
MILRIRRDARQRAVDRRPNTTAAPAASPAGDDRFEPADARA